MRFMRRFYLSLLLLLLASFLSTDVFAQYYFGKNKVQYTSFDWREMTTEHFRILYYEEEEEIAQIAAKSAEDAYRVLATKFNHEVEGTTPLIIYSAPGFFSQTNIIPGMLPESVAGFTEFTKGRVVIPFNGSYHAFDHVIKHELVHVFTFSKLDQVLKKRGRIRHGYPPLWFTEGLAEFWSKEWDAEAEMIGKDMVVGGRLFSIPQMSQIRGTYFMYKLGESICGFIDSTYGEDKLIMLFENFHKGRTFDEVVEITLGDNLAELSRKWEYDLKKKYFPSMAEQGLPTMESRRITNTGFSVKGVPLSWDFGDGLEDWILYKANRRGYSGIYATPAIGPHCGKEIKTLLKGERSSDYESLYLLRSSIDATDSGLVAFSSKSKENDVIYLFDLKLNRVTQRYEFDDLIGARSPRFSPDGTRIVFSGIRLNGFTDLYILDLATGQYAELTNDIYNDVEPCFDLNGDAIVFASDRADGGADGRRNLFKYNIENKSFTQLTFGPYRDQTPDVSEAGIYFSSDRGGTFNIYLLDNSGQLTRQSDFVTGAFDPRVTGDDRLLYTGYQDLSFQVFMLDLPDEPKLVQQVSRVSSTGWYPRKIETHYSNTSIKYKTDYTLDVAQSAIGYDPIYGSLGGFQLVMSDMLGNHSYHLLMTNTARSNDVFLESFNVGLTYINRENRVNWGLGVFHLFDEYYNDYEGFFRERQAGLLALISYPVSKFHRIDLTGIARYSKRERSYGLRGWEGFLTSGFVSWVYDNTLWDYTGPIEGRRYNFTAGVTADLERGRAFNRILSADVRHYLRLGPASALANRLLAYSSSGLEPQRIYFGGSWSLRGFSRRAFYTRKVLFASTELRFPLIDQLYIGSPIGDIGFNGIRGAIFFDAAQVWSDSYESFDERGALGVGARVALGYFIVLRFDFSRPTDFKTISSKTDFDFFFGWNF